MRLLTIAKPAAAILGRRWQSTVQSTLTQPWLQQWFPTGITFAMAYGSGVFKQVGHVRNQNTMVDLIFAVEDPSTWHEANIQANPTHYSGLASLGVEAVVKVQNLGAAKLYYNPYVTVDGMVHMLPQLYPAQTDMAYLSTISSSSTGSCQPRIFCKIWMNGPLCTPADVYTSQCM
eukprot:m.209411 g.209411  ORF g.209411 m.209411 type:complete len:175 (-) comp17140_c2_seq3:692-1216(-)